MENIRSFETKTISGQNFQTLVSQYVQAVLEGNKEKKRAYLDRLYSEPGITPSTLLEVIKKSRETVH